MKQISLLNPVQNAQVELDWHPAQVDVAATVTEVLELMCQSTHQSQTIAQKQTTDQCQLTNQADQGKQQRSNRASYVLVMEAGRLVGIFTERDVLRLTVQGLDLQTLRIVDCMTRNPITMDIDEICNPLSVLAVLKQHHIRHLPIVDGNGQLVGVATAETLRQSMRSRDFLRLRRVEDVMARQMVTATPQATVISLVQQMVDRQVSCVVIVEAGSREGQRPIGIVTERDVVQMRKLQLNLEQLTAAEVMSTPLEWITPEQSLWDIQQAMERLRVRRLVVVEQECLVGIVTQTSILNALDPTEMYHTIELLQTEIEHLKQEKFERLRQQNADLKDQISVVEQRFQAIFNNTFQFTGLMTLDGKLIEANQAALDFGGITRDQVLHRPVWETYWWSISSETQEQIRQATTRAAQGEFVRYEVDVLGAEGRIVTIDFSLRPLRDEQGNVVLLIPEGRDITELKQTQQALEFQVKFDRLVASISNQFIQIHPEAIDDAITAALRSIGEFTQVDGCYIFRYHDQQPLHSMTHEWVSSGLKANQQNCQDLPLAIFPWATEHLQQGEIVHVADTHTLPLAAAIDQQTLQQFGVRSSLSLPLKQRDRVIGLVGFACLHQPRNWTDDNIQLLKSFADVLANALQRQHADTELRSSEQRYASLAAAAPVGIYRTDADGNCLYVNDRWSQIAGMSLEDALGEGWVNGLYPDDRGQISSEWYQATQANRPFQLEYRFQRPDGGISWVFGQAVSECNSEGQITGYVGTITDITDRKRAETALQESEERLRLALTSANQGLYDLNLQTGEVIVSSEYATMLGYDPGSFQETYTRWIERLHPDDREPIAQIYRDYLAGLIPEYKVEFRQQTRSGDWKWILSLGKIVAWDESGNPLRMLGTHTDISDRKAAEVERLQSQQLRSELKLLENILDVILAGYWDWDIPNNYEYFSSGFKRMFGYADQELPNVPETWQRLIFPEDLPSVLECFERHVQSHGQISFYNEVRYRHKNGSIVWVICSGQVIEWDPEGNPLRMIGCHVDITDRKQTELQLKQLNQELTRSNQDLEQFAYITSHDLQEPLRAIIGYTQMLSKDYGAVLNAPIAQESLHFIIEGGERMRHLIQDLLTYSRAGSRPLNVVPTDCHIVLIEVLQNLKATIEEAQAVITIDALPSLLVDKIQLIQLFQNLIGNAIKFRRDDEPPQIHIHCEFESDASFSNLSTTPTSYYRFSISDNGIGIKSQYLKQIFDIFRRLHSRRKFSGTGIGLAICKKIVERHGGEIWVTSEFGQGTTFFFTLPGNLNKDQSGVAQKYV